MSCFYESLKEKALSCRMKFRFIGTGGAFDFEQGNSAAWVELHGKKILLDCGHTVYRSMRQLGIAGQMDYILLTHFHDDHVGSLSTTILHQKHLKKPAARAKILIPPGETGARFQQQIYDYLAHSLIHPENYVDFVSTDEVPGLHVLDTSGKHVPEMITFGFGFEEENEIILFSGDLGDPNLIFSYAESLPKNKKIRIFHELSFWPASVVHSYYIDLEPHLNNWEIYGYHCNPTFAPADLAIPLVANYPEFLFQ